VLIALLLIAVAAVVWLFRGRPRLLPPKPRTVADVLAAIGPDVDARLRPYFQKAGVAYPPPKLAVLAFKREKRVELYGADEAGEFRFVRDYPILGSSGTEGRKRREGDRQVPEGFYRVELLNPNSLYHLSLRVDYPNAEDLALARVEGRDLATLGGDIMIHGGSGSSGCLAMGDEAAEDLFVLARRTGLDRIELVFCPWDLRNQGAPAPSADDLYPRLEKSLRRFSGNR
jgi:hypothetical protein